MMSRVRQAFVLLPGSVTVLGMGAKRLSVAEAIPEGAESTASSGGNNPS